MKERVESILGDISPISIANKSFRIILEKRNIVIEKMRRRGLIEAYSGEHFKLRKFHNETLDSYDDGGRE